MKQYIFLDLHRNSLLVVNAESVEAADMTAQKNDFRYNFSYELKNDEDVALSVTHLGIDGNRIEF